MIRAATSDDIPALVVMGMTFIRSTSYAGRVEENPGQIARFLGDLLAGDVGQVFVSEAAGVLTGTIVLLRFVHPFSGQITVTELAWWVDPAARGHGLRLLKRAEQWARDIGAIWLQMVAPSTEVARVYERLGFEPIEVAYTRRIQ